MQDGLGSVRALTDDAGVVQSSLAYDPYGNPMASYGAGFGFTGEQTDANGAVFLRARYYEPSLGIFNALDPFEGVNGRPMSLNGYAWVEGNVPNAVDPSGNCPDNPAPWDLTGRHCREIARNLAENYNIPFDELVQLPYGRLLQIQALGTLSNTSNSLRDQASNIPIIPTLFYQNPQAAWEATMQVLTGCGSGATVPALGAVVTRGGGQALVNAGGQAASKTPYGWIVAGGAFLTLAAIVGTATLAGHIDRSLDDSNVTAVPWDVPDLATPDYNLCPFSPCEDVEDSIFGDLFTSYADALYDIRGLYGNAIREGRRASTNDFNDVCPNVGGHTTLGPRPDFPFSIICCPCCNEWGGEEVRCYHTG